MFLLCPEAPGLSENDLRGLCVSLNAPVVHSDDLPLGPARAAIALYSCDGAESRLAVAVRSLESGDVAIFEYDKSLSESEGVEASLDRALSFGESLGFLFDEDLIAAGTGAATALVRWREMTGEETQAEPELVLDRAISSTASPEVAAYAQQSDQEERAERTPLPSATVLTKFRRPPAQRPVGLNRLLACF